MALATIARLLLCWDFGNSLSKRHAILGDGGKGRGGRGMARGILHLFQGGFGAVDDVTPLQRRLAAGQGYELRTDGWMDGQPASQNDSSGVRSAAMIPGPIQTMIGAESCCSACSCAMVQPAIGMGRHRGRWGALAADTERRFLPFGRKAVLARRPMEILNDGAARAKE